MLAQIGTQFMMEWQSSVWLLTLAALLTVITVVGGVFAFSWLLGFIMRRVKSVR